MTLTVRSFIPCPLCGKEMRMTSGTFYYSFDCGVISLDCDDCNLTISEYNHHHNLENSGKNTYHTMINILKRRVQK